VKSPPPLSCSLEKSVQSKYYRKLDSGSFTAAHIHIPREGGGVGATGLNYVCTNRDTDSRIILDKFEEKNTAQKSS
jgi:hypothetical protein